MQIIPAHACSLASKRRQEETGWKNRITFSAGDRKTWGLFGEAPSANPGLDSRDGLLPPCPYTKLQIAFRLPAGKRLSRNVSNFEEGKPGETFPLSCFDCNTAKDIQVHCSPVWYPRLVLWDMQICRAYDLSDSGLAALTHLPGKNERHFELWAGSQAYIDQKMAEALNRIPQKWALSCYPNPFNPVARIDFHVPMVDPGLRLHIDLFRSNGARVRRIYEDIAMPGRHHATWKGTDHAGRPCSSGLYLLRMECPGSNPVVFERRLILAK